MRFRSQVKILNVEAARRQKRAIFPSLEWETGCLNIFFFSFSINEYSGWPRESMRLISRYLCKPQELCTALKSFHLSRTGGDLEHVPLRLPLLIGDT